jgi:ribosome-associated protein
VDEADPDQVTEHLLERAAWSASRSSGPGGQRRDKVSTRAELVLDATSLTDLPPVIAARLLTGLRLDQGQLRLTIQDDRSLARNREIAAEKLRDMVDAALQPPPPPRRPTRPTAAAQRERAAGKVRRGQVKRLRRPPSPE